MAGRGSSAWPWIITGLAVAMLVLAFVVMVGISFRLDDGGGLIVHDDEANEEGVIVEIPVEGIIADSGVDGPNPVAWVRTCLDRAADEPRLSGILLRVNSPGGGIRASDEILEDLRKFKQKHDLPIVVFMKDVAASGGYYVAMASDWIVAHEDTITGSIGVIWPTMNWRSLTREKLGIEMGSVKSAPMKDIGSPNREMTAEELALIQRMVDDAYEKFVGLVVGGRRGKVSAESIGALKSSIISGRMALEAGLVDQLGFRADAVKKLKELAGIDRADVFEYARPKSLFEQWFVAQAPEHPLEGRLRRLAYLYSEGPPLMSLWER